jgi:hypothetical protein
MMALYLISTWVKTTWLKFQRFYFSKKKQPFCCHCACYSNWCGYAHGLTILNSTSFSYIRKRYSEVYFCDASLFLCLSLLSKWSGKIVFCRRPLNGKKSRLKFLYRSSRFFRSG